MNIRNELQDTNVKAAIISGMLFFILAFPDLFQAVDTLLKDDCRWSICQYAFSGIIDS